MKKTIFHYMLHGMALLAIAGCLSASAETIDCDVSPVDKDGEQINGGFDQPRVADSCLRAPQQGLAAVLLSSSEGDQIAARWGFLAADGSLAIKPQFDEVRDFHHDLAAAREHGKWGYISQQGAWVIKPGYDTASDFVQGGMAVVSQSGQLQLIGHDGHMIGKPLAADIATLELAEGMPTLAKFKKIPYYLSLQGERRQIPGEMVLEEAFGHHGMTIAHDPEGHYGIVDKDWHWLIKPTYERIESFPNDGGFLAGIGEREVALITPEGRVIASQYERILPLGQKFVLMERSDNKKSDLFDVGGMKVASFDKDDGHLEAVGNVVIQHKGEHLLAMVPGSVKPILLDRSVTHAVGKGKFVFLQDENESIIGILTEDGHIVSGQSVALIHAGLEYKVIGDMLWLYGERHSLSNIIDSHGKTLLSEKTVATSSEYEVVPLENDSETAQDTHDVPDLHEANQQLRPIALITQTMCQCSLPGSGLLFSDGNILINPQWLEIALETGDNSPVHVADWHFRVRTAEGWGVVDSNGKTLLAANNQYIGGSFYEHSLVYRHGKLSVFSRDGHLYPLPDVFDANIVSPTMVRYLESAAGDAPWGLYDFTTQQVVLPPNLADVQPFLQGHAAAASSDGQWGIIDSKGKWTIAPHYGDATRINDMVWQMWEKPLVDHESPDDGARSAIVDASHEIMPFQSGLRISVNEYDGTLSVSTIDGDDRSVMKPDGQILFTQQDMSSRMGSWFYIEGAPAWGYLGEAGQWKILPESNPGTSFDTHGKYAVRNLSEAGIVIGPDGKKVAALPKGRWDWLAGSDWLVEHGEGKNNNMQTRFADTQGNVVLTIDGTASGFVDGRAIVTNGHKHMDWIDRNGKKITDTRFNDLGLPHDGVAYAAEKNKYGIIDLSGKYIVPPTYDSLTAFDSGVAAAHLDQDSLLIDKSGKQLANVVTHCGQRVLYGADHQLLWPQQDPCSIP